MDTLRQEILQSQQARSDLLKWKLGLTGAIGAIGLGFAGARVSAHADLVLCAVPLVCVYVDLLCRHLSLRILVIGAFFRTLSAVDTEPDQPQANALRAYEMLAQKARVLKLGGAFALEDWAVTWSTIILSGAVFAYGAFVRAEASPAHAAVGWTFMISGAVGLLTSVGGQALYIYKRGQVSGLVPIPTGDRAAAAGS